MKKIIKGIALVGLLILAASCGKKEAPPAAEKKPVISGVKVESVRPSEREDAYEAVGTVRSKAASVISSRVTGTILRVHFRDGDLVRAGQVLVEIDDRDAAARMAKAQAGIQEAEQMLAETEQNIRAADAARAAAEAEKNLAVSTFQRYQVLFDRKSVSLQEFEEAQTRVKARTAQADQANDTLKSLQARKGQALARIEQAKAEVAQAQLSQGYTRIVSPLTGLVTAKQAEVGAMASPGSPLLTIEDNQSYRVEALVEDSRVPTIRLGQEVKVYLPALGPGSETGRVSEISAAADPVSRSSIVKIDLPSSAGRTDHPVRSGLYAKAVFPSGKKQVLTIPRRAVSFNGQLEQVYIVDAAQTARLRLIKTGQTYGDRIEILSGLREGERVIVEGMEKVSDGAQVSVE